MALAVAEALNQTIYSDSRVEIISIHVCTYMYTYLALKAIGRHGGAKGAWACTVPSAWIRTLIKYDDESDHQKAEVRSLLIINFYWSLLMYEFVYIF